MTEQEIAYFLQRGIKFNAQVKFQYIRFKNLKDIDGARTKETENHIETLKAELYKNLDELKRIETETIKFIRESNLTDIEKTILELRYLGYKMWQDIGEELGYSARYLLKIHREIINKLSSKKVDTQ